MLFRSNPDLDARVLDCLDSNRAVTVEGYSVWPSANVGVYRALRSRGEILGLIAAEWLPGNTPTAAQSEALVGVADAMAIALDNSRADQTYNTPAIATIFLLDQQVRWMLEQGGLSWCARRTADSAARIYGWAEKSTYASPFVSDVRQRSNVVATIDLDGVQANDVNAVLRANGIVDTDGYRKLGRNQLRIACFPTIEPEDVERLTASIDFVLERMTH